MKHGTIIALAAGSLFASACKKADDKQPDPTPGVSATKQESAAPTTADKPAAAGEKMAKVHCQGVNECKGMGGCKSAANACAGHNGCKGKGFADVATEQECKDKGGTVTAGM
ncbi:MAG: hypothetical protein H0X17_02990 [Deltaproteobacteria bacterium]|nr:hypothetical protein [Deltaproteobacteria bacterium]